MDKPKCLRCAHYEDSEWCYEANMAPATYITMPCQHFKPMTNADHIRSMSDEELAEALCNAMFCRTCLAKFECAKTANRDCGECHLEWLKTQYKEKKE